MPRTVQALKARFPELGVITDVALDPYTSHGQDGLIDPQDPRGYVMNDETLEALAKQALCHAQAGADVVAPSDMMDGRIGRIRTELDRAGHIHTRILAYSAKYASSFYGPFRDAVGSAGNLGKGNKYTYQMDPANMTRSARSRSTRRGADMFMSARHALPGHVRRETLFEVPTYAIRSAAIRDAEGGWANGWLDEKACAMEALLSFKRAGADGILTYYALDAARWMKSGA